MNYDDDGRVRLGHSGAFDLGAATAVMLLPAEGLGIVVLTNAAPIGVPEAVSASFFDLVLKGKIEKDWLEVFRPIFADMAKPAYGTATDYREAPRTEVAAVALGNLRRHLSQRLLRRPRSRGARRGPRLRIGPKKNSFALRHWDRDVFAYQPAGEMSGGLSGVTFWVGPDRRAARVVVENLDIQGQGTFTRPPTAE